MSIHWITPAADMLDTLYDGLTKLRHLVCGYNRINNNLIVDVGTESWNWLDA